MSDTTSGGRREPRSGSPAGTRRRGAPDAHRVDPQEGLSRREMLEVTAAALAAPLLKAGPATAPPAVTVLQGAPKFFTGAEFALLDKLSDLIIPTDAHSPGARVAGVATYIDFRLSESLDTDQQAKWHSGLAAVDTLSQELHGKAFLQGTPEQRLAVLTKMAAGEKDPKTPAEHFFQQLKGWTVRAYYTSKVGIHADQRYQGNVYQRGDYAGYDAT